MLCRWQSPQFVIKGSQRVKHSQKHSQTHETQPPSATSSRHHHTNPILWSESWCSISAAVCSPLISVTVWSQDRDLSLSRSLSQTVWSTPRCVHLEFWLNPNDIYQTQPRFSCGVVKPALDCFNKGSLGSKCADFGLTCQMFRYINISTGRMETESCLRPNAGRFLYVGFDVLLLIIKIFLARFAIHEPLWNQGQWPSETCFENQILWQRKWESHGGWWICIIGAVCVFVCGRDRRARGAWTAKPSCPCRDEQ